MATANPFDLLGDYDNDDPSQLIAAHQQKISAKKPDAPASAAASRAAARLPAKPVPPAQAVREAREARNNAAPARGGTGRGGFGRGGLGRGRGGRSGGLVPNRDFGNDNANGFSGGYGGGGEDVEADKLQEKERPPRQPFSGGRRGGFRGRGGYGNEESGGDSERPPRRLYERRSGTGRGYEMKRDGAGRGNWGTVADESLAQEKDEVLNFDDKMLVTEKQQEQEKAPATEESKENKEGATNEAEEKEEDKEMTLEEYEKIREEKRKAMLAMKAEERKVEIDKELQSMQQLSTKKENDPIFVKLGSDKDLGKKKENADRDERSKKSLSINEFLKPAEGGRYYSPGGRGRGRGRGDRGPLRGSYGGGGSSFAAASAPSIEDPGQFPTLGGK
ncbi:plasminogen activator inhibitor 1 RNA-binding protein [Musa troglodytarum]|uniref:Plasminogen activator inhibitor 1 RNA-binding protein n=1 Tax=Musa troglodytarum TaxID=320322 RepID=A0A9E7KSF6_9LILI|nr:plasminogen activator inhibitor 1 RNA-binding protein [Musa troglodytarum]